MAVYVGKDERDIRILRVVVCLEAILRSKVLIFGAGEVSGLRLVADFTDKERGHYDKIPVLP
jgi:hypothetical protein